MGMFFCFDNDGDIECLNCSNIVSIGKEYCSDYCRIKHQEFIDKQKKDTEEREIDIQKYIDEAIKSGISFRGKHDALNYYFPNTGGSGNNGNINKGDFFIITSTDFLNNKFVYAMVDNPGQTLGYWSIIEDKF